LGLLTFTATIAACAGSAYAGLTINPIYGSSITSDPNAFTIESSIQTAINNLEGDIANPVTINITFSEITSGLADSNTTYYPTSYASYLTALQSNQSISLFDQKAIASLGSGTAANPVNGNANIVATQALLEALKVNVQGGGALTNPVSGIVELNTSLMNISRTGTQNPNDYDLQSAVAHEMDEILGIGGAGSALSMGGTTSGAVGPLDLFRYSAAGVRSYSVTPGADPYFSIDGGVTNLVYFNQEGAADGADMSDWGNGITGAEYGNTPPQAQDAYGTPGAQTNLGPDEMTALDAVGWDLTPQGAALESVPEPGSVCLLAGGLLAIGIRRRRQAA
jgi:hypothetical protein